MVEEDWNKRSYGIPRDLLPFAVFDKPLPPFPNGMAEPDAVVRIPIVFRLDR